MLLVKMERRYFNFHEALSFKLVSTNILKAFAVKYEAIEVCKVISDWKGIERYIHISILEICWIFL